MLISRCLSNNHATFFCHFLLWLWQSINCYCLNITHLVMNSVCVDCDFAADNFQFISTVYTKPFTNFHKANRTAILSIVKISIFNFCVGAGVVLSLNTKMCCWSVVSVNHDVRLSCIQLRASNRQGTPSSQGQGRGLRYSVMIDRYFHFKKYSYLLTLVCRSWLHTLS